MAAAPGDFFRRLYGLASCLRDGRRLGSVDFWVERALCAGPGIMALAPAMLSACAELAIFHAKLTGTAAAFLEHERRSPEGPTQTTSAAVTSTTRFRTPLALTASWPGTPAGFAATVAVASTLNVSPERCCSPAQPTLVPRKELPSERMTVTSTR